MIDSAVIAVIVATLGTVIVAVVGPWLGRRWGLPGIGREIQDQQAALIATLRAEVDELRQQRREDAARIAELEACTEELRNVRRRLTWAEADLLALYRQTGMPRPVHRATAKEDADGQRDDAREAARRERTDVPR